MTIEPQRLTLALEGRDYEILVGPGLLSRVAELMLPALASKRAILVSDATVAPHYAMALLDRLKEAGIAAEPVVVPAGEGAKSFAVLEWLMNALLLLGPDRKTTIIALGGGVVGDLAGFAASILLRGVPFIQVPTTLLAQVDSSVGGKTAINAQAGKNLIGSFYQPKLVLADLDTLKTLPARQWRAGYAEIIKYGLILDAAFYQWCLQNAARLLAGDMDALQYAVVACCRMKAAIVGADEREASARALLNLGHTFGHALEAETGYGDALLHGEAVAIGMVMACRLSEKLGLIGPEVEAELAAHLTSIGLPATPKAIDHAWDAAAIARHFASDKKAEEGKLTFVMLEAIGRGAVKKSVDAALAEQVTASFLEG